MGKFIDMMGQRFGRLTAIKPLSKRSKDGHINWLFKCDCGKQLVVMGKNVKIGNTQSCGCLYRETRKGAVKNKVHGFFGTRFYNIWATMKARCYKLKVTDRKYKHYQGKGIRVCEHWHKFENFRDDMYQSYLEHVQKLGEKQTTIDRINNAKNYELSNCRWATLSEQRLNRG